MKNTNELNNYGLKIWKHKTNKFMFLEKTYRWVNRLSMISEFNKERQHIMSFNSENFDYNAWEPITKEEYSKIKIH